MALSLDDLPEKPAPAEPVSAPVGRRVQASLVFARGGGTTVLSRQVVPYPFHITRAFRMHPESPDLATLYLQSASGGLYAADHLTLDIAARPGARVHVTTQAGTVVHRGGPEPTRQDTRLAIAADAFLALNPDPLILFPGAHLAVSTDITAEPGARAIVTESVACHDPLGQDRPFDRLDLGLTIRTPEGRALVRERSRIDGAAFVGPDSPMGGHRAYGTMVVLGAPEDARLAGPLLRQASDTAGCLTGVSVLPNGAGLGLRLLAPDGGTLSAGMEAVFRIVFEALSGCGPGRRRK
ncbi:Urease accessory protein UreD [Methylorubrum populi BJ001]|jgi:urease accessory protein|uniref:Urease accessory protein UreD 1 n=1 Tax=Methylorubrum populi (strain ATCC BAA-705 / NCIMB 13946 / BJ001) TaxID=441620 RepID=URED1_METPB|nr:urease accessory protein UreD [Methylorubrum populi]B1ZBW7.1 RecName: Full=Urease accessory protein UreD 1 [Methylorubrum populi BJ001]ACB79310.1 Urease accessory protein UreD [Methylorubrum populi BJ001]OAH37016.1 urease accessory protein UreD [Methylorubrum populi]PZP69677.1 MAG: urease accessory protein UreD [Methylorubrum populi]